MSKKVKERRNENLHEKGQIQNKINNNPLKMSNSLDKIYLGGLKSYIIGI